MTNFIHGCPTLIFYSYLPIPEDPGFDKKKKKIIIKKKNHAYIYADFDLWKVSSTVRDFEL